MSSNRIPRHLFFLLICSGLFNLLFSTNAGAQTILVKTDSGFSLMRNGQPYEVKGVGGQVNLDVAVQIGANSIRTWGIEEAQQLLDEAQQRGLTVMLGLWLQHERHGFNYNDTAKVRRQLEHFKSVVDHFKNHPALLLWGIGNEVDLNYSNTNVWYAVQDIANYIHKNDPNHPTSTVTAGLDSQEVRLIKERCPDIDIYCVNTYGDIAGVPENIRNFGWKGPYMITEWGPNGYWESPQTEWKVSIEQSSSDKKNVYFERYQKYIQPYHNHCLGSYAFLWGAKQEYTETWFGLFSKDNRPTEPIDALQTVFTGKYPEHGSPTILRMQLDGKLATENIRIKSGERYPAEVQSFISTGLSSSVPDTTETLKYAWKVLRESDDKKSGGDREDAAEQVQVSMQHSNRSSITFRAPDQEGAYRLFMTVIGNDKVAYANIPFLVEPRKPEDGPAHFIGFKNQRMDFSK
jgi:hypothetical protein